jgi:hypothetical protein
VSHDVTLPGGAPAPSTESAPRLLDPRAPFLLPLALLLLTRAYFWRLLPSASEDAYITFRYARNLTRGLGLVFNPGERVMGFTSPLWTVWSALGIALFKDPVGWSRATTLALEALALVLVTRMLLKAFGAKAAWTFALFYASWTFLAATAVSGMENSAFFALLALSAWLVERRSSLSGVALGLLALMRPEGVLCALIVSLGAGWKDRLVALVLAGLGIGALAAFYGSPIPQSLVAKAQVYGTPGPWSGRHWWEWIVPFGIGRWPVTTEGSVLFAMAVVAGPALAAGTVTLARARREARGLALLAAAGLSVWLGYSVLGVAYFAWYLVLPLATAAVLIAIGLGRVTRGPWIPAGLALFIVGTWTIAPELYRGRAGAEYQSFAESAQALGRVSHAGESVLLEPIGMVGWVTKLRIIDEIGLVSPWVAQRRKQGDGWMADVIAREHPDWLLTRRGILVGDEAFAGRGRPFRNPAERDAVLANYTLLGTVHPELGAQAIEIRRAGPPPP